MKNDSSELIGPGMIHSSESDKNQPLPAQAKVLTLDRFVYSWMNTLQAYRLLLFQLRSYFREPNSRNPFGRHSQIFPEVQLFHMQNSLKKLGILEPSELYQPLSARIHSALFSPAIGLFDPTGNSEVSPDESRQKNGFSISKRILKKK